MYVHGGFCRACMSMGCSLLASSICCMHCPAVSRSLLYGRMASLETLVDGVAMVARSWTNMSEIPEHELDEQIKVLCLQSCSMLSS